MVIKHETAALIAATVLLAVSGLPSVVVGGVALMSALHAKRQK